MRRGAVSSAGLRRHGPEGSRTLGWAPAISAARGFRAVRVWARSAKSWLALECAARRWQIPPLPAQRLTNRHVTASANGSVTPSGEIRVHRPCSESGWRHQKAAAGCRARTGIVTFALAFTVLLLLAPGSASAQGISVTLGDEGSLTAATIQLLVAITLLSLVPGLAVMVTCFPFLVTVLSILRMAIGLQQSPPNMLIVTLALFLTYFVMDPVLTEAWTSGIQPLLDEEIDLETGFTRTMEPFRLFMASRVDPQTLVTLQSLRPESGGAASSGAAPDAALSVLVPSFLLSEIERAFEIGFLIFLPFLIIDLVVAAVLMSMGMMMVPPALVSLPFKLAFFVVADGWSLISEALVRSYM